MNYNEKINNIYQQIKNEFAELLEFLEQFIKLHDQVQNNIYDINEIDSQYIKTKANTIKELIRDFEYYTEFYPNRSIVWKEQIEQITLISKYTKELKIEEKQKS